ncbi:MAG TPA: SAM-dependent methyltransferase, partial [Thermoanaerobaculia bacterium]
TIEEWVRLHIAEGATQIVVLAGGLDTLALRLAPELPQTRFIEVDHPATQQIKRRYLESRSAELPEIGLIAADLARSPVERALLDSAVYSPAAVTCFVAEGLLMYLSEDDVAAIFRFVKQHSAPRSRIVFTYLERRDDGSAGFAERSPLLDGCMNFWLRIKGEPFVWGVRSSDLPELLGRFGLELTRAATPLELNERYLEGLPVRAGYGDWIAEGEA